MYSRWRRLRPRFSFFLACGFVVTLALILAGTMKISWELEGTGRETVALLFMALLVCLAIWEW